MRNRMHGVTADSEVVLGFILEFIVFNSANLNNFSCLIFPDFFKYSISE